jgi:hypothetical protein
MAHAGTVLNDYSKFLEHNAQTRSLKPRHNLTDVPMRKIADKHVYIVACDITLDSDFIYPSLRLKAKVCARGIGQSKCFVFFSHSANRATIYLTTERL